MYVEQWQTGRPSASDSLAQFVQTVVSDLPARDRFADWCFRGLLDPIEGAPAGMSGQWGGGMSGWYTTEPSKPARFALLKHPLTGRVLLPSLLSWFAEDPRRYARWLYEFALGQGYRLPLADKAQLDAVTRQYMEEGSLRPLLELGQDVDHRAKRMLDEMPAAN